MQNITLNLNYIEGTKGTQLFFRKKNLPHLNHLQLSTFLNIKPKESPYLNYKITTETKVMHNILKDYFLNSNVKLLRIT